MIKSKTKVQPANKLVYGNTPNTLARLFRNLTAVRNVGYGALKAAAQDLSRSKFTPENVKKLSELEPKRTSFVGYLMKALLEDDLTWKTYEKGLRLYKPHVYTHIMMMIHPGNKDLTIHSDIRWGEFEGYFKNQDMTDPDNVTRAENEMKLAMAAALRKYADDIEREVTESEI